MPALVTRSDRDGVATLSLNRPEVLNALSPALFVELSAHLDSIAAEIDRVACVVLRGEGRSFSSGNDLTAIANGETAPSAHFQAETIDALERLPQPVIASVRGHCYTGALELVLGCDLLFVAASSKFADTHGKWGMSPTWGMSQRLPRRVGPLVAKDLMLSGRIVGGEEAVSLGLANRCLSDAELDDETHAYAAKMAENSWFTLRMDKQLVRGGLERVLSDGLAFERENSPGAGPDMMERLKGFGKKG